MKSIGEILNKIAGMKTDEEKKAFLEENKNFPRFEYFMGLLVNPEVKMWQLPEGVSAAKRNHPLGRAPSLVSQYKVFNYFVEPTRVRADRLQSIYLGLMDTLHPFEYDFVETIFAGEDLPYLSNEIISEVFGFDFPTAEKPVKKKVAEKAPKKVDKVADEKPAKKKATKKKVEKAVKNETDATKEPVKVSQASTDKPAEQKVVTPKETPKAKKD